jgi:hypothetical protein
LAAFLLAASVAQQRLVNPEKSALTFSTESVLFETRPRALLGKRIRNDFEGTGNEDSGQAGLLGRCPVGVFLLARLVWLAATFCRLARREPASGDPLLAKQIQANLETRDFLLILSDSC